MQIAFPRNPETKNELGRGIIEMNGDSSVAQIEGGHCKCASFASRHPTVFPFSSLKNANAIGRHNFFLLSGINFFKGVVFSVLCVFYYYIVDTYSHVGVHITRSRKDKGKLDLVPGL